MMSVLLGLLLVAAVVGVLLLILIASRLREVGDSMRSDEIVASGILRETEALRHSAHAQLHEQSSIHREARQIRYLVASQITPGAGKLVVRLGPQVHKQVVHAVLTRTGRMKNHVER